MIETVCACGHRLKAKDEHAGKRGKCPKCGDFMLIPTTGSVSATSAGHHRPTHPQQPQVSAIHHIVNVAASKSNSLAMTSLVVGVVALIFCWIPGIGLILSLIGLALAILGGFVALFRSGHGLGMAIGGGSLSLIGLVVATVIAGSITTAFDMVLRNAQKREQSIAVQEIPTSKPTAPAPVPSPEPAPAPVPQPEPTPKTKRSEIPPLAEKQGWLDSRTPILVGDIRLIIKAVTVEKIQMQNQFRRNLQYLTDDHQLRIQIIVENRSETKKLEYISWGWSRGAFLDSAFARLTDNHGNVYRIYDNENVVDAVRTESIYPGKAIEDVLVFERPIDKFEYLELGLPENAIKAGDGTIKIRISREHVAMFD